jgi:hypothetical protein
MASIRLGDLLVKAKVITDGQLKAALSEQQKWGGRLGEILVRMRVVSEDMLVKALSKQLNVPTVNLDAVQDVPAAVKAKVSVEMARDLLALPLQLRDEGKTLVVVLAEPQNLKLIDSLRAATRCKIVPQIASRQAISRAFERFYQQPADGESGGFKVVDAQGNTVIKFGEEVARQEVARRAPPADDELPTSLANKPPGEVLRLLEEAQRKEVAVLKGMVELMIEKGIFTREEYLAKVRR